MLRLRKRAGLLPAVVRRAVGDLAQWPRLRWPIAAGVGVVVIAVAAAAAGLAPFGTLGGAGWKYPLLVLVAALVGVLTSTAVRPPAGAEMTLCDLRWPVLAVVGAIFSCSRPAGIAASAEAILVAVGSVALPVWALQNRIAQERAARTAGEGAVCATCVPVLPAAWSVRSGFTLGGDPSSVPEHHRPAAPQPRSPAAPQPRQPRRGRRANHDDGS